MKKLYVYADFDWLNEIELIGELGYESLRGSDSYCFTFSDDWLKKHGDLFLSDNLNNYPGNNIRSQEKIYSDVFWMHCQTVGGELYCCGVSSLQQWKKSGQYEDCLHSIS